ncbi:hypothetical protein PoB_001934000 [Plakobranchus ocellatus]|uniref:Uncharacterized protein n=1 Tax=Plakobranchus ocellatus TaxID=259542 RepID=A0AAV3ZCG2_9GAST|nr:hypothetical protein PoB_001934000 [Plakobranchus ocellatus]
MTHVHKNHEDENDARVREIPLQMKMTYVHENLHGVERVTGVTSRTLKWMHVYENVRAKRQKQRTHSLPNICAMHVTVSVNEELSS